MHAFIDNIFSGFNYSNISFISMISTVLGIYIIISKNPIISVLFLITLFSSLSVYLIVIGLHFIGLSYLLVYVGAISILFLFILMLINIRISELLTNSTNTIALALIVLMSITYAINDIPFRNMSIYDLYIKNSLISLNQNFSNDNEHQSYNEPLNKEGSTQNRTSIVSSTAWDGILISNSHIISIGNIIYTYLFFPFIIVSLILLVAMIGAISITVNTYKEF